jgi:hypothetical protein
VRPGMMHQADVLPPPPPPPPPPTPLYFAHCEQERSLASTQQTAAIELANGLSLTKDIDSDRGFLPSISPPISISWRR